MEVTVIGGGGSFINTARDGCCNKRITGSHLEVFLGFGSGKRDVAIIT